MENWGLITFRESALLIDSNATSSATKQRVVGIIAHELAHQASCSLFSFIHEMLVLLITSATVNDEGTNYQS